MEPEDIEKYIVKLDNEIEDIRRHALKLTWSMRGGVQYNDVLNMSLTERRIIGKIAEENLETAGKTGRDYF